MQRFAILLIVLAICGVMRVNAQQKNIIFIISDDHRYDAMGFGMQIPLKRNVYPKIDHKYRGQY